MTSLPSRRIALVLGGGGLKGIAHLGVLRALAEREIAPALVAGTSIGSLIGTAFAGGMSLDEMEKRALGLRRSDLFRLDRIGMLRQRQNAVSIYLEAPLRELCLAIVPPVRLSDFDIPVLVNTVDLQQGAQVVWGLPGLRDVAAPDAVYASCALPGFFPPGYVGGRVCADGGVIDNLPVAVASRHMDAVIAVDVGSSDIPRRHDIVAAGFASIYMRAASTMMHALQLAPLVKWDGPPMLLVRPKISHIPWFSFSHMEELIHAGYEAATDALDACTACLEQKTGVFPQREIRIEVDPAKCIGCTLCVALAPETMAMGQDGKAFARKPVVEWSPADGDFVNHCPTLAISAEPLSPEEMPAQEPSQADVPRLTETLDVEAAPAEDQEEEPV
ncbi:MAG TPA: patatin-like phospholipase family protein [Gemmatimonadaceae bacterium]